MEATAEDPLKYDLGNLLGIDPRPLDLKLLREDKEKCIKDTARDDLQLLFTRIFNLPVERSATVTGAIATLPPRITVVPREKPIPKPKPLTRWEKFALMKGIKKKKKERMVVDENTDVVKPRWGYKRANALEDEWVIEAKPNADPTVDPFEQKVLEKKQRVEKQKMNQAKNKMRAEKSGLPATISLMSSDDGPQQKRSKTAVEKAYNTARKSTISMGKFDELREGEKPIKEKQKFDPLVRAKEKETNMKVLDRILGPSEGSLRMDVAVNNAIATQQKKRSKSQPSGSNKKKKK